MGDQEIVGVPIPPVTETVALPLLLLQPAGTLLTNKSSNTGGESKVTAKVSAHPLASVLITV